MNFKPYITATALSLSVLSTHAWADFDKSSAAFRDGDYDESFMQVKPTVPTPIELNTQCLNQRAQEAFSKPEFTLPSPSPK